MTIVTKEAMTTLNRALQLPATGKEQDWDIELADANRVSEFADYLEHQALDQHQKQALMALTLASLEDLAQRETVAPGLLERIKHLLQSDLHLYVDLIRRWSASPNDPNGFLISEMIRSVGSIHQD